jgi:predicted  nucleic acid-binding Zn-ribbon protein
MSLNDLKTKLSAKQAEESSLRNQMQTAREIVRRCDDELIGMGSKKRGKSPEVVAQVQAQIDALRAEKEPAKKQYDRLEKQLRRLTAEIEELEERISRIETLNAQQAKRDEFANPQNNGLGKTPNRQRKIGWF